MNIQEQRLRFLNILFIAHTFITIFSSKLGRIKIFLNYIYYTSTHWSLIQLQSPLHQAAPLPWGQSAQFVARWFPQLTLEDDVVPEGDVDPEGDVVPKGDVVPEGDVVPPLPPPPPSRHRHSVQYCVFTAPLILVDSQQSPPS